MRAVERARSRQVNPNVRASGGTERANDQEFRRRAEDRQRQHGRDDEVVRRAVEGRQAIAAEVADYSKKSFEDGTEAVEKLFGVKSLEKAIEIQTDYAKTAYEGFVAQATKIGELYADLAKETYKPFEAFAVKAAPAK